MNILFVTQNYLPFIGGVELQTHLAAQELSKRHSVTITAVNFAPCRLPRRLAMLHGSLLAPAYSGGKDGNVPVLALTPSLGDRLRMLPMIARALPILQRYAYDGLNRFGYYFYRSVYLSRLQDMMKDMDIVHCMAFGHLGWAAQEAAHSLGLPFVCTPYVHPGQWGDEPDNVAYYKRSEAIIALLESDRQNLASLGVPDQAIRVIGVVPIVSPSTDAAGFRIAHGLHNYPVVLYVGRIIAYKGYQAILQAAPKIWQHSPETRLVFIGPANSEEGDDFENADSRIIYLGRCNDQEKSDALAACDIFCMPSISEILPTVYLEAWSYGKPIVGGKAPGLPELIEGNEGGVTVEQNPEAVADAINEFLSDSNLRKRYGGNGKRVVTENYSLGVVISQLEGLYQNLTQSRDLQAA